MSFPFMDIFPWPFSVDVFTDCL